MKDFSIKKHGDKLLFYLALAIIAGAIIRLIVPAVIKQTTFSIVFTHYWQDDLEKGVLEDLVEEFENLHSEIKIVIKDRNYEDVRNDLFYPSEEYFPGDVLAIDPLWVPELLERNIIENKWEMENPAAARPETQSIESPLLSFMNVLYYNVDILKEAGFSRPPKNRSEFLNYLRVIAEEESPRSTFIIDKNNSRWIYDDIFPWIWAAGIHLINDGIPMVDSRQTIDSFSFLASLYRQSLILKEGEKKPEKFISGEAAFMTAPSNHINYLKKHMGEETFGISNIPVPDNYAGNTFYSSLGWSLGVNKASLNKREARLFAAFLAEKSSLLSATTGEIPGSGAPPIETGAINSKLWDISISSEAAQDFSGLPWTELEKIFREELNSLFNGENTPAGAAEAIGKRWSLINGRR